MSLIKKTKPYSKDIIDVKQLLSLLKALQKENNLEVLHLSIKSIIEDLEA